MSFHQQTQPQVMHGHERRAEQDGPYVEHQPADRQRGKEHHVHIDLQRVAAHRDEQRHHLGYQHRDGDEAKGLALAVDGKGDAQCQGRGDRNDRSHAQASLHEPVERDHQQAQQQTCRADHIGRSQAKHLDIHMTYSGGSVVGAQRPRAARTSRPPSACTRWANAGSSA